MIRYREFKYRGKHYYGLFVNGRYYFLDRKYKKIKRGRLYKDIVKFLSEVDNSTALIRPYIYYTD